MPGKNPKTDIANCELKEKMSPVPVSNDINSINSYVQYYHFSFILRAL